MNKETTQPEGGHRLNLRGLPNTRDLGGIKTKDGRTIKHHRLLRSGALSSATPADLKALVDEYKLVTIVDFRDEQEKIMNPDPVPEGVKHIELPVFTEERKGITREGLDVDADGDGTVDLPPSKPTTVSADTLNELADEEAIKEEENIIMERLVDYLGTMGPDPQGNLRESYGLMITAEHSRRTYRRFFDVLLNQEEGATLFHCAAGKDRVGIGTGLVLYALGVDKERIMEDYLFTNVCYGDQLTRLRAIAQERGLGAEVEDDLSVLVGVSEYLIQNALDQIENHYGDVDGFLHDGLGLTEEDLERLRDLYLEK